MFSSNQSQVSSAANWIEECFSTYLYTGTGSSQTITNNIDTSTKGGLVWIKGRSGATGHRFTDTVRGATKSLESNSTAAEATESTGLTAFGTTGFTIGADADYNTNAATYVSWTFREQAKFFDVVTFTGNGSNRTIAHSLGSVPGCIIIKRTDTAADWQVYHRSLANTEYLVLNTTAAKATGTTRWNSTTPTSTEFSLGTDTTVNANSGTYVAYLFAHDAGGFGAAGTDNVISCGSFVGDGSGSATVNLGYEPQWVMIKQTNAASYWEIIDNMRGLYNYSPYTGAGVAANQLLANTSGAEQANYTGCGISATGFAYGNGYPSGAYIYIAIRRGPMKTPTSGTSVFSPVLVSQADIQQTSGGTFPPDFVFMNSTNGSNRSPYVNQIADRLRSLGTPSDTFSTTTDGVTLTTSSTAIEDVSNTYIQLKANGIDVTRGSGWNSATYGNFIYYLMRRAPGFFDVVCYTGVASPFIVTNSHNLTVVPELIIGKTRNVSDSWFVYHKDLGASTALNLNTTAAAASSGNFGNTAPTATQFTTAVGSNTTTLVAYLFATVTGVSKVGSYTGNGSNQTINCGFTAGARFVMIKRTDSTGDWYVYDTARGIVSGNDPQLKLNSTAAEATGYDAVDPDNSGFIVNNDATNFPINVNNATYIYLAIA